MTKNYNNNTGVYVFKVYFKTKNFLKQLHLYKTITWAVISSGKIQSLITADLRTILAGQRCAVVKDSCHYRNRISSVLYSCHYMNRISSVLFVNESAMVTSSHFDVTMVFSGDRGDMRGCEVRNVKIRGLCFLLVFVLIIILHSRHLA